MYNGDHSIRFYPSEAYVGLHPYGSGEQLDICPETWRTWRLIPEKKPVFAAPDFDDELVAIPGRHGLVRLTKGGVGHTVYGNIKGSTTFIPDPDSVDHFPGLYSDIHRYLHGKERLCVLQDDRYFFYKGLFRVRQIDPDKYWDKITIEYSLEPFKYERWDGEHEWLWDDFDFECGIVRNADTTEENAYTFTLAASGSEGATKSFDLPIRDIRRPLEVKLTGTGTLNVTITAAGYSYTINCDPNNAASHAKNTWIKTLYLPIQDREDYQRVWYSADVTVTNNNAQTPTVHLRYRGAEL